MGPGLPNIKCGGYGGHGVPKTMQDLVLQPLRFFGFSVVVSKRKLDQQVSTERGNTCSSLVQKVCRGNYLLCFEDTDVEVYSFSPQWFNVFCHSLGCRARFLEETLLGPQSLLFVTKSSGIRVATHEPLVSHS